MNETDKSGDIKLERENEYRDIIYAQYSKSTKFKHMSRTMRAAQFAPFAALSGHKEIMIEVARETEQVKELDAQKKEEISYSLTLVKEKLECGETVYASVKFFQADEKKNGGAYIKLTAMVETINEMKNHIVFGENNVVSISDIIEFEIQGTE